MRKLIFFATGALFIRVDGEIVRTMPRHDDSNLPGQRVPIDHLAAGRHTVQVEFVPDKERALKTMFDTYWGGRYVSPVTEFELGPDREVLRVQQRDNEHESNKSDRN